MLGRKLGALGCQSPCQPQEGSALPGAAGFPSCTYGSLWLPRALQAFPLSLRLALRKKPVNPGAAPSLALAFRFLPSLNLVVVESLATSPVTREQHHALLAGLFPGDEGGAEAVEAAGPALAGKPYRCGGAQM